eukprot:g5960.t1
MNPQSGGTAGERKGQEVAKAKEFCNMHKEAGMVNVNKKRCGYRGCEKHPSYGVEGKTAESCAQHKEEGMVNVNNKRCGQPGCNKQSTHGVEGSKTKDFCNTHKQDAVVNFKNERCGHPACNKHPSYDGVGGSKTAEFCAQHKEEGMVNVVNERCGHPGCNKHPSYGVEGSKTKEFCNTHKQDDMVNVKNKRGGHPGCDKQPSFGVERSKQAEFCVGHKEEGMVNVVNKRCGHPTCNKHPSHGVGGSKTAEFCAQHKEGGMVNPWSGQTCGGKSGNAGGGSGSVSAMNLTGTRVGEGRKRKDLCLAPAYGESSPAIPAPNPATVKMEEEVGMSVTSGASDVTRSVSEDARANNQGRINVLAPVNKMARLHGWPEGYLAGHCSLWNLGAQRSLVHPQRAPGSNRRVLSMAMDGLLRSILTDHADFDLGGGSIAQET